MRRATTPLKQFNSLKLSHGGIGPVSTTGNPIQCEYITTKYRRTDRSLLQAMDWPRQKSGTFQQCSMLLATACGFALAHPVTATAQVLEIGDDGRFGESARIGPA
jgi:hypothetical protein